MAEHYELRRQLLWSIDKGNEGSDQTCCTQEEFACICVCDVRLAHILDELCNVWCSLIKSLSWQPLHLTGTKPLAIVSCPALFSQICHESHQILVQTVSRTDADYGLQKIIILSAGDFFLVLNEKCWLCRVYFFESLRSKTVTQWLLLLISIQQWNNLDLL